MRKINDLKDILIHKILVNKNSKILQIGIGFSDHETSKPNNYDFNLLDKYYNLFVSDINYNGLHNSSCDTDILSIIKNRFIKLDLIKDDISSIIKDSYDYIEIRYVLHFALFDYVKRFEILKDISNKLNENGKIGLQFYTKIPTTKEKYDEYRVYTKDEIDRIRSNFNVKYEKSKNINGNDYHLMIIMN